MSLFHQDWDLLLTPTVAIPAFETGCDVPPGSQDSGWPSWTPFTYPFNLTQQPAGSVPCGFTSSGLPVGLQIVGGRYRDQLVLTAMAAFEATAPQPTLAPSSRS
jgi:aspartyl-tRNA(Asn)/glutamyl-tRNA(Gln) amidotransferase subunit A